MNRHFYKILVIARTCMIMLIPLCTFISGARASNSIVVLMSSDEAPYREVLSGFQISLRNHGVNIMYDVYVLGDDVSRNKNIIQKVKTGETSLIFTLGTAAAELATSNIADIPIVFSMVLRMDNFSKAHNASGVVLEFSEEAQIDLLKRILPDTKNIGVIFNPEENQNKIEAIRETVRKKGFNLIAEDVANPKDLPNALKNLANSADVMLGITDRLVLNPQTAKHILLFSFRNRIPFIGLSEAWVKAGALYSLSWDYTDLGVQSGEIAINIMQGANISSIPVAYPRKVLYVLNLRTAQNMKINVPDELISNASHIYKD